tara:strand:- start:398 stop:523 length:126 start_codon:yes stop_codon:yes gene_type:complete
MPVNKPIPDSFIEYWKIVFKDLLSNLVSLRNQSEMVVSKND